MRGRVPPDTATRFWRRVDKSGECWLWIGSVTNGGYARFPLTQYDTVMAHRWAWEQWHGPIADGLQIDHLCRVRNCVNPAHLEPVTPKINTLRGLGLAAQNSRKTHCAKGHEYNEKNTRYTEKERICRPCRAALVKRNRHAKLKETSNG